MKNKKMLALLLSAVLLMGAVAGGTLAWFTDQTDAVVNTFTVGNIDIELDETTGDTYKMIPGWTIDKDPLLTVTKGSEDAWLFIKVEKTGKLDDYIAYAIDTANWTELPGENGVYYSKYESREDVDITGKILAGGKITQDNVDYTWNPNQVLVKPTVTKEMMDALEEAGESKYPTLTFTAYACQYWKGNNTPFTPTEAWAILNPPANP